MNDDSADFAHRSSEASSALVLLSLPVSPKTPNSSESTLVWVIVGKTQHPAWLLEEDSSLPSSSRSLVRWTSTGKSEWVDSTTVHTELPCRQTKRRVSYVETKDENDDDVLAAATTTTTKPTGFAKLFPLAPTPSAPPPAVEKSGQGRKKRARSEPTDSTPATKMQNVTTSDAKMALIFKIADVKSTRFGTGVAVHVGRDESFEADGNLVEQNRNDSGEDVPLIEFGKQSTGNSNDDDDDDQDDSVEFICTMRPLSSSTNPTRSVSRSPPQFPSIEANVTAFDEANDQGAKPAMCAMSPFLNDRVTGSSATSTLPLPDACPRKIEKPDTAMEPDKNKSQGSSSLFRSSSTREDPYDNVDASQQAALSESIQVDVKNVFSAKEYALRTSAYLQNLAEISYTVLWDVRWRVSGANALPLFQWEKGDDLSAMIALSRCYEPMPTSTKYKCTCLLCHDEQGDCFHAALPNRTNAEESIGNVSATVDLIASMSVLPGDRETAQGTVKQSQFSPPSAVDTLQDQSMYLYSRLFYRKGPWFRLDDIYNKYYVSSAKKSFLNRQRPPMESTIHATESRKPSSTSSVLDKILLAYHLDHILPSLFDSVELLYSSGMIRFFQDETECGKTVGKSLLHSDERQFLLTKLGAKKKAGRARDGNSLRENEVWKQMSQPKLFFPSQPNGKRSSVLPARIHVESIFLEKLAKSITVACCRNDNIPAHEMRKLTSTTMKSIQDLIGERYKAFFTRHFGMCFRLREEPTQTLQRCVRLYLCALAGPGDMRGNGTNGWRSVKPITVANVAFEGIVQPPGQQNWFQVEHPGLSVRLGLSSACFFEAYRPLPVNDLINLQCGHQSEQVFCSRDSFLRWELCVELRANVDYLVELNEALRSEARREALGKKSRYGKGYLIASSGSVDLLSLLTFDGRQAVLCKLLEGDENLANVIVEVENDISASNPDLQGECEKVLGVIGVIAMQVLCLVNLSLVDGHDRELKERSWLRHMHWQACMAYFLFDIM